MDGTSQLTIFNEFSSDFPAGTGNYRSVSFASHTGTTGIRSMLYVITPKLLSPQALLNQILTNIQMLVQNAATLGASAAEMLAKMPKEAARMSIVVIIVLLLSPAHIRSSSSTSFSSLTVGAVKG